MNDAERMRFREAVTGLPDVIDGFFDGQLLLRREERRQIDAVEALHHDERQSGTLATREHPDVVKELQEIYRSTRAADEAHGKELLAGREQPDVTLSAKQVEGLRALGYLQ